jgi:hypothetical protein
VAIGAVFAAINLWPVAARGFEALTALTPLPWAIVVDPMDLIALPTLLVSWRVLVPTTRREAHAPRWLAIPAIALGALACMATSPPVEPTDPPPPTDNEIVFQELWGNIAIANDRDEAVAVRVRRLRATVFMDCDFVADNPTDALSRDLFGPAEFWEVDPGRAFGLESWREWEDSGNCDAFLVDGAGLTMQLIFLDLDTYPWTTMGSTVDSVDPERTLFIEPEASTFSTHPALFSAPPLIAPEPSSSCETATAEASVAWSDVPAMGTYSLERVIEAPDGCMELTLVRQSTVSNTPITWFLCLPRDTFPFEVGEEFFVDTLELGADFGTITGVELSSATKAVRAARGQDFVHFNATTTLSVEPAEGCGFVHDDCGNLTQPLVARYGGPSGVTIAPGEAVMLGEQSYLYVVRAHEIPVGDSTCLEDTIQSDRLIESVFVSY